MNSLAYKQSVQHFLAYHVKYVFTVSVVCYFKLFSLKLYNMVTEAPKIFFFQLTYSRYHSHIQSICMSVMP